jgi:hypothetical protein
VSSALTALLLALAPVLAQLHPDKPFIGGPPPAPVPMLREEMKLWRSLQTRDLTSFQSMLAPDFAFVGHTIQNRDQALSGISSCKLSRFSFVYPKGRMVTPDLVVLTYNGIRDATCGSGHLPADFNASSVWVRRDGQWLLELHTETPNAKP